MFIVRDAVPADADALAEAHLQGWRVGYRGIVPDSYLDSPQFADQRHATWQAWTWNQHGRSACFAVEVDGRVMGFGLCGPARAEPACDQGESPAVAAGGGEVYAFYLHPDAWGSGAAAVLMGRCTEWLRTEGFASAILWVLRDNPRARAFYERAGWQATGNEGVFDGPHSTETLPYSIAEVEYRVALL